MFQLETVGVPAASVTATQADSGTTGNEVAMTFTALDVTNAGVGIDAFSVACTGCDDAYGRITSASAPLTGIIYGLPPSEEITDLLVFAMGPHPGGYSASPAASVCTGDTSFFILLKIQLKLNLFVKASFHHLSKRIYPNNCRIQKLGVEDQCFCYFAS